MRPLILLIIAAGLWYFFFLDDLDKGKRPVEDDEPARERVSEPEPAPLPSPPPPVRRPELPPAPQVSLPRPVAPPPSVGTTRVKPPKGSVPFKMVGEFVVAFGDVLIGKPTERGFPENGFIPAPKVKPWKSAKIAYSLHQDLPNPERVLKVIEYFNTNTPIQFVPLADHKDSLVFAPTPNNEEICLSYVGKIGGHQPIFIHDRCGETEIIHEIMHAIGFVHEHSRPVRDQYVRVNWDAIEPDKQAQFEVVPDEMTSWYNDRPFDYNSVTLYEDTDFARSPGDVTLQATYPGQKVAPVQEGLSEEDLNRLRISFPENEKPKVPGKSDDNDGRF